MGVETRSQSVEREIVIAAKPEVIWELITDPKKIVRWMGKTASFDLKPGGNYRIEVIPDNIATGEFLEILPPRRLVYTWGWEKGNSAVAPGSTTITFELIPQDHGTLLRFSHRDLPTTAADRGGR